MSLLITPPTSYVRADGALVEVPPSHCPAGHPTTRGLVLVGHERCACQGMGGGHRTYWCCWPDRSLPFREQCGEITYDPPCTFR